MPVLTFQHHRNLPSISNVRNRHIGLHTTILRLEQHVRALSLEPSQGWEQSIGYAYGGVKDVFAFDAVVAARYGDVVGGFELLSDVLIGRWEIGLDKL
jgi:hypothetical protein